MMRARGSEADRSKTSESPVRQLTVRKLRVQRIEDEQKPGPRLHVDDLPQIDEWSPFFRELINAANGTPTSRLACAPDIVAIDFGFAQDRTLPNVGAESSFSLFRDLQPDTFKWSSTLRQPNTGLLIASAIMAMWSGRDFPIAVALHSAAGREVWADMSSAVLVAQMMALGGTWQSPASEDQHPLVQLATYLEKKRGLCTVAGSAISSIMPQYRRALMERLGAIGPEGNRSVPRLFADPISVAHLQEVLASGSSSDAMDEEFASVGLSIIDTNGRMETIDLRSIFCDRPIVGWSTKAVDKLHLRKNVDEPSDFVAMLSEYGSKTCVVAADVVQHNKIKWKSPRKVEEGAHWAKFLALAFALVEDQFAQFRRLNSSWDPVENVQRPPAGSDTVTLNDQCLFIAQGWFRKYRGEKGEVSAFVRSLSQMLKGEWAPQSAVGRLFVALNSNGQLIDGVENLLEELRLAGVLKNLKAETAEKYYKFRVNFGPEDSDEAAIIRGVVQESLQKREVALQVRLAKYLGIFAKRKKQDYSGQLEVIEGLGSKSKVSGKRGACAKGGASPIRCEARNVGMILTDRGSGAAVVVQAKTGTGTVGALSRCRPTVAANSPAAAS